MHPSIHSSIRPFVHSSICPWRAPACLSNSISRPTANISIIFRGSRSPAREPVSAISRPSTRLEKAARFPPPVASCCRPICWRCGPARNDEWRGCRWSNSSEAAQLGRPCKQPGVPVKSIPRYSRGLSRGPQSSLIIDRSCEATSMNGNEFDESPSRGEKKLPRSVARDGSWQRNRRDGERRSEATGPRR